MAQGHPLIIIGADRNVFAVNVGESFTIPASVPTLSPTSDYVPAAVAGSFQNLRDAVGGQTIFQISDAAGPSNAAALEIEVLPGDVVALSAVAGGFSTLSINGIAKARIACTAAASVIGVYA